MNAKNLTNEQYIEQCKKIHGENYTYELTKYISNNDPVTITCKVHGPFTLNKASKIRKNLTCPSCGPKYSVNKDNFKEVFKEKHGDKYDYSESEYINADTKIKIKCNSCGEYFEQRPTNHINSTGCKKCSNHTITKEEFIQKAKEVHGEKFNYDNINFINMKSHIELRCDKHGLFKTTPSSHLLCDCERCSREKLSITGEEFIKRAMEVHGDKYIYDETVHGTKKDKIKIICKEHGPFMILKSSFLNEKIGCKKCNTHYNNTERFIEKAKKIHGDKYDYSLVDYKHNKQKVTIKCKVHGEFEQIPNTHLLGGGCKMCADEGNRLTNDEFIQKAKEIHGNKYNYSKTNYTLSKNKVIITCEEHGDFEISANTHLSASGGCSKCVASKGETRISEILTEHNINFEIEKKFFGCVHKRELPFDFYLTEHNILIEYDGKQHFQPINYFGGEETFNTIKQRDQIKNEYCLTNNIPLLRIRYNEDVEKKLTEFLKQQNII